MEVKKIRHPDDVGLAMLDIKNEIQEFDKQLKRIMRQPCPVYPKANEHICGHEEVIKTWCVQLRKIGQYANKHKAN